ncbi:MAG: glycosyltransferase family 39 protein [Anaerolineaceae bacterium]|nr:glycosyltransferase family 39 protein [Anaerolineaceae bacterium]
MTVEKLGKKQRQRILIKPENIVLFSLFILNSFFILSRITPNFYQINPYDGAKYIESGHQLLTWGVRELSWGPLVALIYAPLDLLVGQSPNWFLLEAWAGNVILFGLLWFGIIHLAKNMKEHISYPVIIGLLFFLTIFFPILENQSDALFLFFSMMAVAALNSYRKNGALKNLGLASLMVGLGVLCRVETVLLVAPLFVFALIFNQHRQKLWKVLLAALLPFVCIMGIYAGASLLTKGYVNWGVDNKSIESFDMNHAFLPGSKLEEAYLSGESIIGSAEEHHNSVLRIFINRPMIFVERFLANLLKMPASFADFFSPIQGILVFALSLLGIVVLIQKKDKGLFALLLIWPLHALVALLFLPRHVVAQMSFVFIILAAIGMTDLIFRIYQRKWLLILLITSVGFVLVSGFLQAKALFSASLILACVLLLKMIVESGKIQGVNSPYLVFALFVGCLLFLSPGFEFPARPLGLTDVEKVVYRLQDDLPEKSAVLAPSPIVPVAARMVSVQLPYKISDGEGFLSYLVEQEVRAVYLDNNKPDRLAFISQMIIDYPENFELAYQSLDGAVRLYFVEDFTNQ